MKAYVDPGQHVTVCQLNVSDKSVLLPNATITPTDLASAAAIWLEWIVVGSISIFHKRKGGGTRHHGVDEYLRHRISNIITWFCHV